MNTNLAELVGSFQNADFQLGVDHVSVNGVSDAEQLMGIKDDKFGVGHKHFWRLITLDCHDKGIDGITQINSIRLGLASIEFHHVPVIIADLEKKKLIVIIFFTAF